MRLVKGGLLSNKHFKLRQHQADAIDAANDFFFDSGFENPRGIICLPTGGGKTVTAISFIVDAINNGKIDSCLWVVHREELCNQAVKTFNDFGIDAHKWTAKEKSTSNVTVCMLQSTRNITRSRKHFDLIVVDEAHHFSAEEEDYENTYVKLIKKIDHKYLLGLTATPTRLDNKALNFDKVVYSTTFYDMVQQGYLAKPNYHEIRTERYFQLSGGSKNDFTQKSLGCLDDDERNEKIAEEWARNREKFGKTIVFCVSVEHCHNLMTKFRKHNTNISTAVVTGKTDKFNRDTIVKAFDEGDIDVLFNCQVFTEGFDSPTIETVIVARPTMSESLFMQMIGRGSRITKTKKEYNLVVVVDDVQRFASVVKQWKPLLVGKTKEDLEQERADKELKDAFDKLSSTLQDNDIDIKLGDISPIDVEGVLTVSGRYKQNQSFIIDRDRNDCLRRLFFLRSSSNRWGNNSNDRNLYINSYTKCVPQGEFNHKEWETICYAWYDFYVNNNKHINVGNESYETWNRIPLVELTEEDKKNIKQRIVRSLEIAEEKNNKFNTNYNKDLLYLLINKLKTDNPKKYKSTSVVYANIDSVVCKDREITVQTSLSMGDRFYIGAISNANKTISAMLADHISDPCCKVRFRMRGNY